MVSFIIIKPLTYVDFILVKDELGFSLIFLHISSLPPQYHLLKNSIIFTLPWSATLSNKQFSIYS